MDDNAPPRSERGSGPGSTAPVGEDPAAFRVLTEIGVIHQHAATALERVLPDEISLAQFGVLHHLARLGGEWTPLRLAGAFHVSKGAMTNTLKKLQARAFVTIAPDPADGRGKIVRLTAAGLKARNAAIARAAPIMRAMIKTFGEERFEEALPFLTALRAYLISSH